MSRLPMITYEDTVGTRIKLIDYANMARIIETMAYDEPDQVEYALRMWGEAIYQMGQGHKPAPHLIQPLKVVAS